MLRTWQQLNLTPKLALIFVLFAAILLAGVGVFAYYSGRAALQAATISSLLSIANEKEEALNNWVADKQTDLIQLANSPTVINQLAILRAAPPDAAAAQEAYARLLAELKPQTELGPDIYLELFVIEPNKGQIIVSTNPAEEGKFKEDRPYFINGKDAPYVESPYYSLVRQGPTMTAAVPVHSSKGELLGVLAGRLVLDELNAIIQRSTNLHQTLDVFLVNTSNLFVTQPRYVSDPAILQRQITRPEINRCLQGENGVVLADDYRGVPAVIVYRWLPDQQLCLKAKLDQAEVFAPIAAFGNQLWLIGLLGLLIASALAMGLARTIIRPVLALQQGAIRLGRGKLDVRLPETTGGELGRLAREFNRMAAALAEKEARLRTHAVELEQKVAKRTAALQASEAELRALFAAMVDIVFVMDREGRHLEIASTNSSLLYKPPAELVGKTVYDIFPEEQAAVFVDHVHLALEREQPVNYEYGLQFDDGEIWFAATISPMTTDSVVWVARDITERKHAEGALRESEERFRSLAQTATDAIINVDVGGHIRFFNQAAERIFGYTVTEIIGQPIEMLIPEDYRAEHKQAFDHFLETGQPAIIGKVRELTGLRKGDVVFPLELSITKVLRGGEVIFTAIIRDITERKEAEEVLQRSEQHFRLLIENALDIITIMDGDGTIKYESPSLERILGYEPEALVGKNALDLVHPDDVSALVDVVAEGIQKLGTIARMEYRVRHRDGSWRIFESIGKNLMTNPVVAGIVINSRDVTEHKQAEEALRKSEELFRQVITSISPHIYVTEVTEDGQRLNRYLSPNIESLTGYPYEKFITEWSFWPSVVIHPEDRAKAAEQAERLVMGQASEVEYRMVRADGEVIWVRDSGRTKAQGASRMIYGVVSDITENRWAREEIVRLYTAERERYLEAEALRQAALALASTLDLNQVIERILVGLQNVVPYDTASVQLLENEHHLKIIGGRGFSNPDEIIGALLPTSGHNPNVAVLETKEPVIVKDAQEEYAPFMTGSYESKHIRGWLGVPMSIGAQIIGTVTLDKEEPDFYTEAHAQTAMAYAAQAAIAIENARLYAETKKRAQQLAVIHELDRAISASLRIEDVYRAFSDYTGLLLTFDRISIVLMEEDNLHITYVAGLAEPVVGTKFPLAGTTSERVLARQKPELIKNVAADANYTGEAVWGTGMGSAMVLPFQIKGETIGTWNISRRQVGFYDVDDLHIAQLITDQLTIGIENAHLFEQAQQEIRERKQAQEMLESERASLAQRVAERTSELRTANAELARAARLKDEFLANMSHELRTPLNAILGMSEVLQMETYGSLNDKQQDSLKYIEEGGHHLIALINDILDVSKIEAGKLELNLETTPVEDVCQASLRFVQQQALNKQIQLVFDFDESVKTLEVDQRRLKQILVNLLTNAVKFTPSGGQVGLEVARAPTESEVHFTVWDTGMGISKKDLQKLFKPFVQLDSSLARKHEGTGLGLVLVYRLAELHGGGVSVESEVGKGSRFTVSIPWRSIDVYRGNTSRPQAESPEPINVSDTAADFPGHLILLAEDNQANLILVQGFLEANGYEVIVARNGAEAVDRAREERPDLILMDIQMPGMDGLEAIRHIRADRDEAVAGVPIIALTALAMVGDKERCLEAGANTYLSKPIGMQRLLELIEEFLGI